MTDQSTARDRVRAFLDRRANMLGLDPVEIVGLDGGDAAGGFTLTTADLRELVDRTDPHLLDALAQAAPTSFGEAIDGPSIGTRSPSVRLPHDQALRHLRPVLAECVDAGVHIGSLFHAVLAAVRGQSLGGPRERLEADTFAAIAELPDEEHPLDRMIGKPGQRYLDRENYAVMSVRRVGDGPYRIDVEAVR